MHFALLFAATLGPADYVSCERNLVLQYTVSTSSGASQLYSDYVRGSDADGHCQFVRIRRLRPPVPWALEIRTRRVSFAGEQGQLMALRPPWLQAPLRTGAVWHFGGMRWTVLSVDESVQTPAGRFEGCVRLQEEADDGSHRAVTVYAPGVGRVRRRSGGQSVVLSAIKRVRPPLWAE